MTLSCASQILQINSPDAIKGDYEVIAADFGTQLLVSLLKKKRPTHAMPELKECCYLQ